MTYVGYTPRAHGYCAYWRVLSPITAYDLESMFNDAARTSGRGKKKKIGHETFRLFIYGTPCKVSPDWALRHPKDASEGKEGFPYPQANRRSLDNAMGIVYWFKSTGDAQGFDTQLRSKADFGTNFANVFIGATKDDCWQHVERIDVVDI